MSEALLTKDAQACAAEGSAPAATAGVDTPWVVHFGPFSLSNKGLETKPQLKIGGSVGSFKAEAGLSDVRDGLHWEAGLEAFVEVDAEGHSVSEVHEHIRQRISATASEASSRARDAASGWSRRMPQQQQEALGQALEKAEQLLATTASGISATASEASAKAHEATSGWSCRMPQQQQQALGQAAEKAGQILAASASGAAALVDKIAQSAGIEVSELKWVLSERSERPITLRVRAVTGVGVSTGVCLGWCDTNGYHMVGVKQTVTNLVALGGSVSAGKHVSGTSLKLILGIGNFTLEYTLPLAPATGACEVQAPEVLDALDAKQDVDVCGAESAARCGEEAAGEAAQGPRSH